MEFGSVIPRFESWRPSQPVRSARCDFRLCQNWTVPEGVVQAGHLRSYALAGRTRFTSAPATSDLPVEGYHPCPKPLKDDQRHRWISLLELLMSETGRCRRRPQRHAPRDRATVVRAGLSRPRGQHGATTWRAVLIGSCLGGVLSSPGKCLAIDNQLGSLLQHIEGKGAINVGD